MTNHPLHIVFAGGGTGGHLFPGLAVARQIADRIPSARITFVGSGKQFEWRQVSAAGFEYLALPCRPLPRQACRVVRFMIENLAAYLAAGRFLDEESVAAVVGLGGYVSVPTARAAARRRLPLVLLEQNVMPGRATRWLARSAACVCTAFEQTRSRLASRCVVQTTGNPIRAGFGRNGPAETTTQRRLLILGGTNGAQSLNQEVPRAVYKVRSRLAGWQIVHQSGQADVQSTQKLYDQFGLEASVVPFVTNMPGMLSATGLCVCRAGGTTLAELAAAALPAVLLPYPHATDDHQRANADLFSAAGGAVTLDSREMGGQLDNHLSDLLDSLLGDSLRRARMSAAMGRLARPNAARDVADIVIDLATSVPYPLPTAA